MSREKYTGGVHAVRQLLDDGAVRRLFVADNKKSKNVAALVADARAALLRDGQGGPVHGAGQAGARSDR